MGYEKEKKIERDDNRRRLASVLKSESKVPMDFSDRTADSESLSAMSDMFLQLVYGIADGDINFYTLGKTRDGGAILLTVTDYRGVKSYASGVSWLTLARACRDLFSGD